MRSGWILGCLVLLLGTTGCERLPQIDVKVVTETTGSIRIVRAVPSHNVKELEKVYAALGRLLTKRLGRPVEITPRFTLAELSQLLKFGQFDLAWVTHTVFIEIRTATACVPLVRVLRDGKKFYRGAIVVGKDSGLHTLADLKSSVFAYVDRRSGSGLTLSNELFRAAGIVPTRDFKEIWFTSSYAASLKGLLAGRYDAVAVPEQNLESDPAARKLMAVLARTRAIPTDVVAAHASMDPALMRQLRDALLSVGRDDAGRKILEQLDKLEHVSGFTSLD
jgi:phosphate/phosphite/phosphonate ABC transporter binding protein